MLQYLPGLDKCSQGRGLFEAPSFPNGFAHNIAKMSYPERLQFHNFIKSNEKVGKGKILELLGGVIPLHFTGCFKIE